MLLKAAFILALVCKPGLPAGTTCTWPATNIVEFYLVPGQLTTTPMRVAILTDPAAAEPRFTLRHFGADVTLSYGSPFDCVSLPQEWTGGLAGDFPCPP